jgi:hypothetical protein
VTRSGLEKQVVGLRSERTRLKREIAELDKRFREFSIVYNDLEAKKIDKRHGLMVLPVDVISPTEQGVDKDGNTISGFHQHR